MERFLHQGLRATRPRDHLTTQPATALPKASGTTGQRGPALNQTQNP